MKCVLSPSRSKLDEGAKKKRRVPPMAEVSMKKVAMDAHCMLKRMVPISRYYWSSFEEGGGQITIIIPPTAPRGRTVTEVLNRASHLKKEGRCGSPGISTVDNDYSSQESGDSEAPPLEPYFDAKYFDIKINTKDIDASVDDFDASGTKAIADKDDAVEIDMNGVAGLAATAEYHRGKAAPRYGTPPAAALCETPPPLIHGVTFLYTPATAASPLPSPPM
jgi:hypothetical protein